jgi:hypothetical protein
MAVTLPREAQVTTWGKHMNTTESVSKCALPIITTLTFALFLAIALVSAQAQASSSFACPDPSEKQACDSYSELAQAGDKGVTGSDVKYVCFSEYVDDFFVIQVGDPYLSPRDWFEWNKKTAQYALKNWREFPKLPTYSSIQTYSEGVENDSKMPSIFVLGSWRYLGVDVADEFVYRARPTIRDSRTNKELPDSNTFLVMNADQVEFAQAYTSATKQKVQYSLVLQRSTKRFHETFTFPDDPKKGSDNSGRCFQLHPFPRLPAPPTLTEDQQAEKEKVEYCTNLPDPDEWSEADRRAYCASSIIYQDDYLAAQRKK